MASDKDEQWVRLVEDFRPRLTERIKVEQVLDHLQFIESDLKEEIRQKARTEGEPRAANVLISAVIRKPHSPGWFRAFVDALVSADCESAADYLQDNIPEPEVEADNDCCVRLIQILCPSLVGMKTDEVCVPCYSEGLLTEEDLEIVSTLMGHVRSPFVWTCHAPQYEPKDTNARLKCFCNLTCLCTFYISAEFIPPVLPCTKFVFRATLPCTAPPIDVNDV